MGNKVVGNLPNKLFSIFIFLLASYVCFLSTREYVEVAMMQKPPRHPFGDIEKMMAEADAHIEGGISVVLKDYNNFMLYIAGGSFLVGAMFVIAWFVDKMFKFAWVVLLAVAGYFLYKKFM